MNNIRTDKRRKSRFANSRRRRIKRRKNKKYFWRRLLLIAFSLIFFLGAGGLLLYYHHLSVENGKLDELAERVNSVTDLSNHNGTGNSILPKYEKIYNENKDLFGWIKIDDTNIDYPVMHTPNQPEKYLHTNFEGKHSRVGLPFLDEKCSKNSDNLVIYAHNMKDGSMFRTLFKYENKEYWEKHPIIEFDTIYKEQEYEVMSVFYDRVYYKHEDVFKFYKFIDAKDEAEYEDAIDNFKKKQLYDTGIRAKYGDQLITLVTCSYHEDNGRFVVVARKIS